MKQNKITSPEQAITALLGYVIAVGDSYASRHNGAVSKDIEASGVNNGMAYAMSITPENAQELIGAGVDFNRLANCPPELLAKNVKAGLRIPHLLAGLVGAVDATGKRTALNATARTFCGAVILMKKMGANVPFKWNDRLLDALISDHDIETFCNVVRIPQCNIGSVSTQKSLALLMGEILGVFIPLKNHCYKLDLSAPFIRHILTLAGM